MLALPILTEEARDSLDAPRHTLARLSAEEARQVKRYALFADTFGALDRVALQRELRQVDRAAISKCLASGIRNVPDTVFRLSPSCFGETNHIQVRLDDEEQVSVYAAVDDGPVIFLPPTIPVSGVERSLFIQAFALLTRLPFSLPNLTDVYGYWGWTGDDVEVVRDWLPAVFQQGSLSVEQMERVIRQTARHKPLPELESFDMTDDGEFSRLAWEVASAIENDEFTAFFERVSDHARRQVTNRERLTEITACVAKLQEPDSLIFWTMFVDDLSQIVAYQAAHEPALVQVQSELGGNEDNLPLLSDIFLAPDTVSAAQLLDEHYDHFLQVGEEAAETFPMEGAWADRVRMTVNFANIQYSTTKRLAERLQALHHARDLHDCQGQ